MFLFNAYHHPARRESYIRLSYLFLVAGFFLAVISTLLAVDPASRKSSIKLNVKKGPAYGNQISLRSLDLSRAPTDDELKMAGQLGGALSPEPRMEKVNGAANKASIAELKQRRDADNLLFGKAMQKWNEHRYQEAVALFKQHRKEFPQSQWTGEVELHAGCEAQFNGRWSEAAFAFDWILNNAPKGSDIYQKARLRRSVLYMEQGEVKEAMTSFSELLKTETNFDRKTYAQGWIRQLSQMRKKMKTVRTCGSESVAYVLNAQGKSKQAEKARLALAKTEDGFTMKQLTDFAAKMGLKAQAVSSKPFDLTVLPKPFIAHYRDLHYVVVREILPNGHVRVYDPRLKHHTLLSRDQFTQQWSGLAVIFGARPENVRLASARQLQETGGCCGLPRPQNDIGKPDDPPCKCPPCNRGLPGWSVNMVNMNLYVSDIPLWYSSPRGPSVDIELSYNSQIAFQYLKPFGEKWTFNYASYAMESPGNSGGNVTVVMPDGRSDVYVPDGSGGYISPTKGFNKLTKESGAYSFKLELQDGTVYRYGLSRAMEDNSTSSLLLSITDRFGQALTITHDSNGLIKVITDALGRETTFFYTQNLISRIEDPFGRYCTFAYDVNGNLIGQSDMAGISYSYTYDSDRYMTGMTTPSGTTKFYIEPSGPEDTSKSPSYYPEPGGYMWESYRITVTHPDLQKEEFYFNGYGEEGRVFSWHRNKLQYKSAVEIVKAPKTKYYFSVRGDSSAVESIVYADGSSTSKEYNSKLQPTNIRDENNHFQSFDYNEQGRRNWAIDARDHRVSYGYATNGIDLTHVTNQLGKLAIEITYNDKRQVATVTDAMTNTTAYGYNTYGQLTAVTNALSKPEQRVTTIEYSPVTYLPERVKVAGATVTTYTYDSIGRVSSVTDANKYKVRYAYDGLNRLIRTIYPDGTSDQTFYSCCKVEKTIDRAGRTTSYLYDKGGNLAYTRDAAGRITQYERDAMGNLTRLIDGNGHVTKFAYDARGRVSQKTYADGRYDTYGYDAVGNTTTYSAGLGGGDAVTTIYNYNPVNQLTDITYSDDVTPSVHFEYDDANRRAQMTTPAQGTTIYTYDDGNRLTDVDGPMENDLIHYDYDSLNRLVARDINGAGNNHMSIQYDGIGRISTLSNPLGTFTYSYTANSSRLTDVYSPNGQHITYGYLPDSGDQRLGQIQNRTVGNAALSQFNYAYDNEGQITQWTQQVETNPSMTYTLGYDATDALTRATLAPTATPSATVKAYSYTYDKGDNRLGEQIDGVTRGAAYNSINQLTNRTAAGVGPLLVAGTATHASVVTINGTSINIDARGNFTTSIEAVTGLNTLTISATNATNTTVTNIYQTTVSTGSGLLTADTFTYDSRGNMLTGNGRSYAWDAANRLKAITYSGDLAGQSTEFTYDGYGRRTKIEEKNGGAVTSTKLFVWDGLQMVEERDANNNVTKQFHAQGQRDVASSTNYFYTRDHLGSIREVVDGSGVLKTRYSYDPYGRVTVTNPTSGTPAIASDFGYTGHYTHAKSGLVLAPYRAYDAGLGRWLSRDPIAENGGINLYGYVGGDPANRYDLLGLAWTPNPLGGLMIKVAHGACIANGLDALAGFKMKQWVGLSPNDKYYHCMASCKIARICGSDYAEELGNMKESRGGPFQGDAEDSRLDQVANAAGRCIAKDKSKTCEKGCQDAGYAPRL